MWSVYDDGRKIRGEEHSGPKAAYRAMLNLSAHEINNGRKPAYHIEPPVDAYPLGELNLPEWALSALASKPQKGWLPVAGAAATRGLDIDAYWEGDPEIITRVSVSGHTTGQQATAAVAKVLTAYGVDPDTRVTWERGEGEGEEVAFLTRR